MLHFNLKLIYQMKNYLVSIAFSLATASISFAGLIAFEGFDYANGTLIGGATGGTGWASGWQANGSDNGEIVNGRLSWTNGASGDGWSRQLATPTGGSALTFVAFEFEYDRTAAGDAFWFGIDNQIRNPRGYAQNRISFGRNGTDTSQTVLEARSGGNTYGLGTFNVDSTDPVFVVLGINAAADTVDIWLNPVANNGLVPSALATATNMGLGSYDWLNWSGSWNNWKLDNVAVGSSFIDVAPGVGAVPEPSTYAAILGAMSLGFVFWRRRRKA